MAEERLRDIFVLFMFGVFLSLLLIEFISNNVPLFQTDIKFVAEGIERDPELYARFNPVDSTYFSADLVMYRVKTNPITSESGYYVRDDTVVGQPYAVAIGDSFTFCAEIKIEDCWVSLLEEKVSGDVVNMGGPGQFSLTEEKILEKYGLPMRPKVVIWEFLTNDMSEAAYFQNNNTEPPFYGIRKFLNGRSNVYLLLKRMINSVSHDARPPIRFKINGMENTFNDLDAALNTNNFCNTQVSEEIKDSILRSKQKSEETGAKFFLVMIPMEEEVYIDEYNQHLGTDYDLSCPIREVKEFADKNQIDYIDMTPVLKENKSKWPYLLNGGHLSPEGNRILSDSIDRWISEKMI